MGGGGLTPDFQRGGGFRAFREDEGLRRQRHSRGGMSQPLLRCSPSFLHLLTDAPASTSTLSRRSEHRARKESGTMDIKASL